MGRVRLLIDQCVYTPYYQSRFPSRQGYHTSYVCPRLPCAHDGPSTYMGIVKNLRVKAKILAYCIGLPRVPSPKIFGDLPPVRCTLPGDFTCIRTHKHMRNQGYILFPTSLDANSAEPKIQPKSDLAPLLFRIRESPSPSINYQPTGSSMEFPWCADT